MRWLLISGDPYNPGDQFSRVGVERLVREADKDADIWNVHKESHALDEPSLAALNFDRAVLCGMPLFWSWGKWPCWEMSWWEPLLRWAERVPLLCAGVGSFAPWPCHVKRNELTTDDGRLWAEANRLQSLARRIYARDWVAPYITDIGRMLVLPCPSIFFSRRDAGCLPRLKLCNFMPHGAHYARYNPDEAIRWGQIEEDVMHILRDANFLLVAHTNEEAWRAEERGWQSDRIITDAIDTRYLLAHYGRCARYFGNRIHGAIVSRSVSADVWCCGYDSRLAAVELVGGRVSMPSEVELLELRDWAHNEDVTQAPFDVNAEWITQLDIFKEFAS